MVKKILLIGLFILTTVLGYTQVREYPMTRPFRTYSGLYVGENGIKIDSVTRLGDTLYTYVNSEIAPFKTLLNPSAGVGDMLSSIYDPQNILSDAFDRVNMTGSQDISTINGLQDSLDRKINSYIFENILQFSGNTEIDVSNFNDGSWQVPNQGILKFGLYLYEDSGFPTGSNASTLLTFREKVGSSNYGYVVLDDDDLVFALFGGTDEVYVDITGLDSVYLRVEISWTSVSDVTVKINREIVAHVTSGHPASYLNNPSIGYGLGHLNNASIFDINIFSNHRYLGFPNGNPTEGWTDQIGNSNGTISQDINLTDVITDGIDTNRVFWLEEFVESRIPDSARNSDTARVALKFIGDSIFLDQDTITGITPVNDSTVSFNINGQAYVLTNSPSVAARGASGGLSLISNDIVFGGSSLSGDVEIPGAGYGMEMGASVSRLSGFEVYTFGDFIFNTSGSNLQIIVNGKTWEFQDDYLINQTNGDTLAPFSDVRTLIENGQPYIPFNFNYTYDATTTDSRPGIGLFRFNNLVLSSVTQIYVDYFDANSVAKNNFMSDADTGSYITVQTDENNYAIYQVTGGFVDAGNYYKFNVTYLNHNGVISGLSTIDIDHNNNTGGSGGSGGTDSTLVSHSDTIIFTGSTLDASGKTIVAEKNITDTIAIGIDENHLLYTDGSSVYLTDSSGNYMQLSNTYGQVSVSNGSIITDLQLNTSSEQVILRADDGTNIVQFRGETFGDPSMWLRVSDGVTSNDLKVYVDSIVDRNMEAFFKSITVEKTLVDTLITNNDTITGTTPLKDAIESEIFDKTQIDTLNGDSVLVSGKLTSDYYLAQMYIDGDSTLSVATADTYFTFAKWNDSGTWSYSENLTITDSTITINSTGYGYYDVNIGSSYTHSVGNTIVHASLFVNDIEVTAHETQRKIGTGGDVGSAGREATVLLIPGDVLKVKFKADNTGTITLSHAVFKVVRIN